MPSYQSIESACLPKLKPQIGMRRIRNYSCVMPATVHGSQTSIESLQLHLGIFYSAKTALAKSALIAPFAASPKA